jgi:hypothetical protein
MAIEIERKLLVRNDSWRKSAAKSTDMRQAYLAVGQRSSTRVRIKDGKDATLTVKSKRAEQQRLEVEYPIAVADAERRPASARRSAPTTSAACCAPKPCATLFGVTPRARSRLPHSRRFRTRTFARWCACRKRPGWVWSPTASSGAAPIGAASSSAARALRSNRRCSSSATITATRSISRRPMPRPGSRACGRSRSTNSPSCRA